jgi:hypothetical protein
MDARLGVPLQDGSWGVLCLGGCGSGRDGRRGCLTFACNLVGMTGVVARGNRKFVSRNSTAVVGGGGSNGPGDFWQQELRRSSRSLIENPVGISGIKGDGTATRRTVEL